MKPLIKITLAAAVLAALSLTAHAKKSESGNAKEAVPTWYKIKTGKTEKTVKVSAVEARFHNLGDGTIKGVVVVDLERGKEEIPIVGSLTITAMGNGPKPQPYGGDTTTTTTTTSENGEVLVSTTTTRDSEGNTRTETTTSDTKSGTITTTTTTTDSDGDTTTTIEINK